MRNKQGTHQNRESIRC